MHAREVTITFHMVRSEIEKPCHVLEVFRPSVLVTIDGSGPALKSLPPQCQTAAGQTIYDDWHKPVALYTSSKRFYCEWVQG